MTTRKPSSAISGTIKGACIDIVLNVALDREGEIVVAAAVVYNCPVSILFAKDRVQSLFVIQKLKAR